MGGSIVGAETARVLGDVRVATASIVDIDNWLGVDVGHVVGRALLLEDERAYICNRGHTRIGQARQQKLS